jgi:hypothetical protein
VLRTRTVKEFQAALEQARASDRTTVVYIETDPLAPVPSSQSWWDVPVSDMGGFLATLLVLAIMGAVMTVMGGFTPGAFRVAWLVQSPVWLMAVIGVLIMRRQARRLDAVSPARGRQDRSPFRWARAPQTSACLVGEHSGADDGTGGRRNNERAGHV